MKDTYKATGSLPLFPWFLTHWQPSVGEGNARDQFDISIIIITIIIIIIIIQSTCAPHVDMRTITTASSS